jgi:hypothetical protein
MTSPARSPDTPTLGRSQKLLRRFGLLWENRERPRIEDFLEPVAPGERPAVLAALLPLEWSARQGLGESVRHDEYARRFPDFVAAVTSAWEGWSGSRGPWRSPPPSPAPSSRPAGLRRRAATSLPSSPHPP